jgi:hypothetical protein
MLAAIAPASDPLPAPGRCGNDGGEDADDTGGRQAPVAVFVQAAHDRGHGGMVESGKRRTLHEGANTSVP